MMTCDCNDCYRRLRYLIRKARPVEHYGNTPGSGRCPGSDKPPRWISDKSIDIDQLWKEYREAEAAKDQADAE